MNAQDLMKGFADAMAQHDEKIANSMKSVMQSVLDNYEPKEPEGKTAQIMQLADLVKGAPTRTPGGVDKNEPGIKFARYMKLALLAQKNRKEQNGHPTNVQDLAEKMYAFDKTFVAEMKAVSVTGDGGYLVPEDYTDEVIQLLYADTVAISLGARIVPMPNGNLNMPKLISGSSASYIGENQSKKASKPKYANIRLSAKKLACVVPISNDVLRSTSYASDMYVRDDMVKQMQLKMDATVLFGEGTESTPRGIKNTTDVLSKSVGALPTTSNTYDQVTDVESNDAAGMSMGWAFNSKFKGVVYNLTDGNGAFIHREELNKGRFHGYPYKVTNQIPTGTSGKKPTDVYFGDWAEILIGEQMQLEIRMSEDATYENASGDMVSAFANDQTVMRSLMIHDFSVARPKAFSVYNYNTIE
ncbi:MAG: phage major capsid protein [Firmicutes bacterium]|nr:phage major capsid protein [Bacillota bacterium]